MIRSFGVVVLWSQDCIGCSKVPAGKLPGNIILLYINNCWIGQQTSLNLVTDDASYYYCFGNEATSRVFLFIFTNRHALSGNVANNTEICYFFFLNYSWSFPTF